MPLVELTVPPGVAPGDLLEFSHEDVLYNATVPDGLSEGDLFQIDVADAAPKPVELGNYLQERAATGDLMDRFAFWFEENEIERFLKDT